MSTRVGLDRQYMCVGSVVPSPGYCISVLGRYCASVEIEVGGRASEETQVHTLSATQSRKASVVRAFR